MTSTDVHNPQDLKTEDWAGDMAPHGLPIYPVLKE